MLNLNKNFSRINFKSSIRFINTDSIKIRSVNYVIAIPESVLKMDAKTQKLVGTQFFHLFRKEPKVLPYFASKNKEDVGIILQHISKKKSYNVEFLEGLVALFTLDQIEDSTKHFVNHENESSNLLWSIPLDSIMDVNIMSKAFGLDISNLKLDITIEFTKIHLQTHIFINFLEI